MEEKAKNEQIGFHKGSLSTLVKERQELLRIVKITEELIKAHTNALKELGIDLEKEAKEAIEKMQKEQNKKLDEKVE
ncbi:hypothetical protein J4426_00515 [Candidatus Woesearchaeota archaeon]|nr:hypothetical protein [Candidatus Woesearchaeota archaeon]